MDLVSRDMGTYGGMHIQLKPRLQTQRISDCTKCDNLNKKKYQKAILMTSGRFY